MFFLFFDVFSMINKLVLLKMFLVPLLCLSVFVVDLCCSRCVRFCLSKRPRDYFYWALKQALVLCCSVLNVCTLCC